MSILSVVRSSAVAATGLAAGVLLGHMRGVSAAMPHLDPSSFVTLQQIVHDQFVPMMPVLLFGSTSASILWAILSRSRGARGFLLIALAAAAMTIALGLTLAVNVPINQQLMTWSRATPPSDLMTLWRPWENSHSTRTVLALVAFGLQTLALGLEGGGTSARSDTR